MVEEYMNYRIGEFVDSYETMIFSVENIKSNYTKYQNYCNSFTDDFLVNQGKAGKEIVNYIVNAGSI